MSLVTGDVIELVVHGPARLVDSSNAPKENVNTNLPGLPPDPGMMLLELNDGITGGGVIKEFIWAALKAVL